MAYLKIVSIKVNIKYKKKIILVKIEFTSWAQLDRSLNARAKNEHLNDERATTVHFSFISAAMPALKAFESRKRSLFT